MVLSTLRKLFSSLFFASPPKTLSISDIMADRDRENSSPIVKGFEHSVVTYMKSQLWQPLSSSFYQDARQNRHLYKVFEVFLYKSGSLNSYHEYILAKVEIPPCDAHYAGEQSATPRRQFIYVRMERTKEKQDHLINVVEGLDSRDSDIRRISCEMIYHARSSGLLASFTRDKFADAKAHPTYVQFLQDLTEEMEAAPTRVFKLDTPPAVNGGLHHSKSSSSRYSGSSGSPFPRSPSGADRSGIELFTSIFTPIFTSSFPTDGRDVVNFKCERPPATDKLIHSLNVEGYGFILLHLGLLAFEINRADPLYSLFKHQCYWWAAMFIGVIQRDIADRFPPESQPQSMAFDPNEEQSYYLENVSTASKEIKQHLKTLSADTSTSPTAANDITEPEPTPNPHLQSTYRNFKVIGPHHTMIAVIFDRFKYARDKMDDMVGDTSYLLETWLFIVLFCVCWALA